MSTAPDEIAAMVRRADPDRYLAALFAPAAKRGYLMALYAFNVEIARVADTVREPMMGEIRLEWWRETLAGARQGMPRNHPVARALTELFGEIDLPPTPFEAMIAARAFDASAELFADRAALEAYCDATSGNLMRLAAQILGRADDAVAREAGIAYALTGIMRAVAHHAARHKSFLPQDLLHSVGLTKDELFSGHGRDKAKVALEQMSHWARDHLAAARAVRIPRETLAAYLPAALVPLFLSGIAKRSYDPLGSHPGVPIHRRQIRLLGAALRRRF